MRSQRSSLRPLIVAFLLGTGATTAHAACPDRRASCVLHEEGVALFLEGKHQEAAAKFAAAIAAEPTARSYLGYAQAVEALGQVALAYDTMVTAQRFSQSEVQQAGGKDVDVTARAERIKYKLGELRGKIAFAWLRVPDGVNPKRVISVQRQGEGDLKQPLTQWTAVAPGRQVFVVSIDDGTRLEVVAELTAGSQGVVVIPIAAPSVATPTAPGPQPAGIMVPLVPTPPPLIENYVALGVSILAPGPKNDDFTKPSAENGLGFTALYERALIPSLGLAGRLDYAFHGRSESFGIDRVDTVSGYEVLLLVGGRTWGSRTIHGRVLAGLSLYSQTIESMTGATVDVLTRLYPALELGGGLHLGRFRIQGSILFSQGEDNGISLGTRFLGTMAIDLYRK